jgi:hypothetical protein
MDSCYLPTANPYATSLLVWATFKELYDNRNNEKLMAIVSADKFRTYADLASGTFESLNAIFEYAVNFCLT